MDLVKRALVEDGAFRDITSAIIPNDRVTGRFLAKQDLVVCGLDLARRAFGHVGVTFRAKVRDGKAAKKGSVLATVTGPARRVLAGERVALNFVQQLSGVATITRRFADRARPARVFDTRKTTPGLRVLEKHAVACGGGRNHRLGLYDAVLIKDNHLAVCGSVAAAVARARAHAPELEVEVEADTLAQVEQALAARADAILLDNMSPAEMREAVRLVAGRARTEASGGITLETIRDVAERGVDTISIGALTHSAPALDVSLEVDL
jgi:nicotinate-nucleotide pyrophosphorylase (carboxylating)